MKTKKTFSAIGSFFDRLVLGFFGGALSALPGFDASSFSDTTLKKEETFRKRLCQHVPYGLGLFLGFFFFFLVPVQFLFESYRTAVYGFILWMAFGFLAYNVYRMVVDRQKGHTPFAAVAFVVGAGIALLLHYFPLTIASFTDMRGLLFLGLFGLLGSALLSFCGISFGSLLFLSGLYIPYSELFSKLARIQDIKTYAIPVLVLAMGMIVGSIAVLRLKKSTMKMERHAGQAGFLLALLVLTAVYDVKPPFLTEIVDSVPAQFFIIVATSLAGLGVAVAFTFHGYRVIAADEKKEEAEEEKASRYVRRIQSRKALAVRIDGYYRRLLLDGLSEMPSRKAPTPSVKEMKVFHKETPREEATEGGIDLGRLKAIQEEMKKK